MNVINEAARQGENERTIIEIQRRFTDVRDSIACFLFNLFYCCTENRKVCVVQQPSRFPGGGDGPGVRDRGQQEEAWPDARHFRLQ